VKQVKQLKNFNTLKHFESIEDLVLDDSFCEWIQSGRVTHNTFWAAWQTKNTDKQSIVEEASQIVLRLSLNKQQVADTEINEALNALLTELPTTSTTYNQQSKNSHYPYKWAIAASFILLLISWFTLNFLKGSLDIHQTAYGEIVEIQLPDATKVVLQANSTLKVPKQWKATNNREVWLEGEAFFDVATSTNRFIVNANDFEVEVLGTEFNVLSRKNTKRVALQEGKIKLASPSQTLELAPNELLTYETTSKQFIKSTTNAVTHTAWTEKDLYLDQMDLSELIRMIEDNYGYTIQTNLRETNAKISSIGAIKVERFEDLLAILKEAYNLKITQTGKVITLSQ